MATRRASIVVELSVMERIRTGGIAMVRSRDHCSLIVRGFRGHVKYLLVLSLITSRSEVDRAFSAYGHVVDVHIPRDYYSQ